MKLDENIKSKTGNTKKLIMKLKTNLKTLKMFHLIKSS